MTDGSNDVSAGGPGGPPRSSSARRRVLSTAVFLIGAVVLATLVSRLPPDTDASSLVLRAAVGLAIGGIIVVAVRRSLRSFTAAPPAPPVPVDARSTQIVYECSVCGTRLRLETAATAKAPRHCGEEMTVQLAGADPG